MGQLRGQIFSTGLGERMRKIHLILWAIPLAVALSGCTMGKGGGLLKNRTGGAAGIDAAATPLDTSAIQTQTLGPAPAGSAANTIPATGRVIGAAPTAPVAATKTAATSATATSATATSTAATPTAATSETAADIGAAAAAALKAGAAATTAAATTAAATAEPAAPQSAEEAACGEAGGRWAKAGDTGAMSCVYTMKDAGKACSKESDCSSQCLARSKSCAPFWPMFGCTDVVQNDGAVVSLCLN